MAPHDSVQQELTTRREQQLYRARQARQASPSPWVIRNNRKLLNFSSNDYLGLSTHPQVIEAAISATQEYGVGSGASQLITGYCEEQRLLELELAEFLQRPRSLIFSTGYMANQGVLSTFAGRSDHIYIDRLCHASIIDGALASGAALTRYPHLNVEQLRKTIDKSPDNQALIASDGVFSMDGDIAPVAELSNIAIANKALLMIDDAHGIGALGSNGRGCLEALGVAADRVDLLVGTFGKAFGAFGAFVAATEDLVEMLIQHARTLIYTTALPPAILAATRASLRLFKTEAWRREKLNALIEQFRVAVKTCGLPVQDSSTAIQPLIVGDSAKALQLSQQLTDAGFLIHAIRSPTVPVGSARLRITLTSVHEPEQITQLVEALKKCLRV